MSPIACFLHRLVPKYFVLSHLFYCLQLLVSLNMTMLVGLSVDYVVHLAEGYHLSHHKDRLNRTRDMLEEMATSVFSGACTTLGASLFMFGALVQFFMQFGIFLFCTIGFSLFFSLGLFTLLMGLIGPQNNTGCLKTLYRKCRDRCRKKETDKNEDSGNSLHVSDSVPSITTVGSQNQLLQTQVPPHITRIKVNGNTNPVQWISLRLLLILLTIFIYHGLCCMITDGQFLLMDSLYRGVRQQEFIFCVERDNEEILRHF